MFFFFFFFFCDSESKVISSLRSPKCLSKIKQQCRSRSKPSTRPKFKSIGSFCNAFDRVHFSFLFWSMVQIKIIKKKSTLKESEYCIKSF